MTPYSSRGQSTALAYPSQPGANSLLQAALLGITLLAGMSATAHATEIFKFTYSGGGVLGSGTVTAQQVAPNTWLAISGTDTTTGGAISGTLSLAANPNSPAELYSASGYFIYDNLLYPGQDPVIDNGGLLFINGTGDEVNLFSYGPDAYTHYDNTAFNVPITFEQSRVPEPASLAALGAGLAGLTLMRRRKPV